VVDIDVLFGVVVVDGIGDGQVWIAVVGLIYTVR